MMICRHCGSDEGETLLNTYCPANEAYGDHDMTELGKSIRQWSKEIHENAVAHGWWETDRNIGEQIALMHSELSEALEEWRSRPQFRGEDAIYTKDGKPEGFGIELADCVIRIMDTCFKYGIDLEEMIRIKHTYNLSRPYRHGGKIA